jgi:hypothetical protein
MIQKWKYNMFEFVYIAKIGSNYYTIDSTRDEKQMKRLAKGYKESI